MRILRDNSNRNQVRLMTVALLAVLGLVAAGYGGSAAFAAHKSAAGAQHATSSVAVSTRKVSGLGTVLVNSKGRTLYVFMNDKQRHVTCTGSCASFWPPMKWKGSGKPTAGGAAKAGLVGTVKNPSGGRSVTYNKWPLYTYSGDSAAGQSNGEGQNLNGGKWYVISAKGTLVKHRSAGGGGGGGGTTGGGGWG